MSAAMLQYDLIMGTINACTEEKQAELVRQLVKSDTPVAIIAMRLPYDLAVFPQASTYMCTYRILEPSIRAAAKALFGFADMPATCRSRFRASSGRKHVVLLPTGGDNPTGE